MKLKLDSVLLEIVNVIFNQQSLQNPVKDVIFIRGLHSETGSVITIVNANGNLVKRLKVNTESVAIDVSQLLKGNYYLKAEAIESSTTMQFYKE